MLLWQHFNCIAWFTCTCLLAYIAVW